MKRSLYLHCVSILGIYLCQVTQPIKIKDMLTFGRYVVITCLSCQDPWQLLHFRSYEVLS